MADVSEPLDHGASTCPLSEAEQTRNIRIYAANWAIIYLSSPVTYVGVMQAALLNRLGFSDGAANLPAAIFLASTPLSVITVWAFPQVRMLRRLLIGVLLTTAVMGTAVAAAILFLSAESVLAAAAAHAALWGCSNGVFATCQWEMMGRGVSEERRGEGLALAFGAGPFLAVFSSLATQFLLGGEIKGFTSPFTIVYPWNFAALYFASAPILGIAAVLSLFFVVPKAESEVVIAREPFLSGVFGGIADYFRSRVILLASLAYIMVYSGHEVLQNIMLYSEYALDESPEKYAGLQQTFRFGFKIAAGFLLGRLLMKSNPRMLLIVTALLTTAGVAWASFHQGTWFLVAFGILGAGELFGVYYPNYILNASPREHFRRNMTIAGLITVPVGFMPLIYGGISDAFGKSNKVLGFQLGFALSMTILASAIVLVWRGLPKRPAP